MENGHVLSKILKKYVKCDRIKTKFEGNWSHLHIKPFERKDFVTINTEIKRKIAKRILRLSWLVNIIKCIIKNKTSNNKQWYESGIAWETNILWGTA